MPNFVEPKTVALLFTGFTVGAVATQIANDPERARQTVNDINDALSPVYRTLPYVGVFALGSVVGILSVFSAIKPPTFKYN